MPHAKEMWNTFEPLLQQRLSQLDESSTTADRVHAALLEFLPSGSSSIAGGVRTSGNEFADLQRQLSRERENFQGLLNKTHEALARRYLTNSDLKGAETSFLLGFEDPNSFFRAFHHGTGETPDQVRCAARLPLKNTASAT